MWDSFIITPFTNVLLFIYQMVGNFGVAIILFTLLIRLVTHPLTVQQLKGSAAMQELQNNPRMLEAKEKYKNDKEKLAQVQTELMRDLKINPLASCLPTLIQFPIIIGLYQSVVLALGATPMQLFTLTSHIYPQLLKVETLIPLNSRFLWIPDLGQPDIIPISFLPSNIGIPILAIIVVITTYVQSKLMTPPPSGGANDQGAMMGNMMNIYMPFIMGWMALTLSSGLSLYFVASNLIGIGQYALLGKADWRNLLPGKSKAKPASKSSSKPVVKKS